MSAPTPAIHRDDSAEASVIGCVLGDPATISDLAVIVGADDFTALHLRGIWLAMLALDVAGQPIDEVSVAGAMADAREFPAEVVAAALNLCFCANTSVTAALRHATRVRDKAILRALVKTGGQIADLGRVTDEPTPTVVDRAQLALEKIAERLHGASTLSRPLAEVMRKVWSELEARFEGGSEVTGLASGLTEFDRATTGLHPGDLIILAARPAMGKTSLAMQIAWHAANLPKRGPVQVFSLEMPAEQLAMRLLASQARVPLQVLRSGQGLVSEIPKLARAAESIASLRERLVIEDGADVGVMDVRAKARALARKRGAPSLIVVDYLQILRGDGAAGDSREREVAAMSGGLKRLARELGCPVIALSQLSRKCEERKDRRPMLSDLRDSGAIEQDADLVCFLYRDEVYDEQSAAKGKAELIIAKQRNGPIGTIDLAFIGAHTRFENIVERPAF